METFNKILITHHHHSMSFHFTSGNLKAWFAHLFSYFHFHVGFICPGFEISASRISTSTLIVWRRMEFGLWFSHRNLITEKKITCNCGTSTDFAIKGFIGTIFTVESIFLSKLANLWRVSHDCFFLLLFIKSNWKWGWEYKQYLYTVQVEKFPS